MKTGAIISLLLILSISLFGQEKTIKEKSLKLYTNFNLTSYYPDSSSNSQPGFTRMNYEKEMSVFNFSPAIVFRNQKGNSHELELSRLWIQKQTTETYDVLDSTGQIVNTISGETVNRFHIQLRYEYTIGLFKKKNWVKLNPSIGFSAAPFYRWEKYSYPISTQFPISKSSLGIYLAVIPRIQYNLNEKWYLDLNVPISIVTVQFNTQRNEDPSIPVNQRTTNTIGFYNTPFGYAIRFGLGMRL